MKKLCITLILLTALATPAAADEIDDLNRLGPTGEGWKAPTHDVKPSLPDHSVVCEELGPEAIRQILRLFRL